VDLSCQSVLRHDQDPTPLPNLLVEDVDEGSTGHRHFQVVGADANPLDQNPALLVLRNQPDRFDIEVPEDSSENHGRSNF